MTPEQAQQKTHSSLLKSTRQAKGLTLDIVHEATKIPLDALKAIEEGYSVRILTPFYYRGFLKIYAEFLGLDSAEILSEYPSQKPRPAVVPSAPITPSKPNEKIEAAGEFFKQTLNAKTRKTIFRFTGILLLVFCLFKIGGCVASAWKHQPAPTSKKKTEAKAEAKSKPIAEPKPLAVVKAPMAEHSSKAALAVRALKDTWLQVKADGKIVFQMKMKKGSMESWEAKDSIELSGKNINELDLEINGRHIGALGSAERGAKKVVINKQGLTVQK